MENTLLLPFLFPFMQQAFLVGILVAIPTAILSPFLVLKGWALIGDAIAHAILPGLVLALAFGFPVVIGAAISGGFFVVAAGYLQNNSRIKPDTTIGVTFVGFLGAGLLLHARLNTGVDIHYILLGDLLGIEPSGIWQMALVAGVICLVFALFWRAFMLQIFDPIQAQASGINISFLHYALLGLLVLCTIPAISITGVILTIAFLIAPGAIAFLLVKRLGAMIFLSMLISIISTISGIYLSFFINSAPAPTVVLTMAVIFLVSFLSTLRQRE